LAQVLAEQEAWKIAKESGLDLVTILPNFVLGPILSTRTDGTSVGFLKVRHTFSAASIFLPSAKILCSLPKEVSVVTAHYNYGAGYSRL
jgi:hypothetical protein